jgi:single-strand DNA-binding protein
MSVNKVILVGHLGADPELRTTGAGTPVCNMRLATNRVFYDKEGQKQEETNWHRVVTWGKQAETCNTHLSKGKQVFVEGRIQNRTWEDKEGNKRYADDVVSRRVIFLGNRAAEGPPQQLSAQTAHAPSRDPNEDIPF